MSTTREEPGQLRRAVLLMTASSVLVPAAGLLTQPVLARALGAAGRGELAAALAPAILLSTVATLGLPDALTYFAGARPRWTRSALRWSISISVLLGLLCVLVVFAASSYLSAGDEELGTLIVLSMALWIPLLAIGALRGAARGFQAWTTVAAEGVVNAGLRIACFLVLWATDHLTVVSAVLVTALAQLVAGAIYVPVLRRHLKPGVRPVDGGADVATDGESPGGGRVLGPLLNYGSKVWFGSIAGMLVARIGQILMVPLSSAEELGLFSVAVTISDVPIIVALAVSTALQGVNSRSNDATQVATTSRLALLISVVGCGVLAALTPVLMTPLFGEGFSGAVLPTILLLVAAVVSIPGVMAGAGLAAFGRPGLRSWALALTFVVNLGVFVLLVPSLGAVGACWASIAGNVVLSAFMVLAASRVLERPATDFCWVRWGDVVLASREGWKLALRGTGALGRSRNRPGRS